MSGTEEGDAEVYVHLPKSFPLEQQLTTLIQPSLLIKMRGIRGNDRQRGSVSD